MSSRYSSHADLATRNGVESPPTAKAAQKPQTTQAGTRDADQGNRLAWLDVLRGLVVFDHLSYHVLQPARWAI